MGMGKTGRPSSIRDKHDSSLAVGPLKETLRAKVRRLLDTYPDRLPLSQVAIVLGLTKSAVVKYHQDKIPYMQVEGIKLFDAAKVQIYARSRRVGRVRGRITLTGVEVDRIQRICERYYRQNMDIAPTEVLALAKRIARLV